MLRKIAEYSTQLLIRNDVIREKQRAIYIYGFELFWSTFFGGFSILLLGSVLGYLDQAIFFLLFFLPIRTFAGGYHAKSYRNCFLITNIIAFSCIILTEILVEITLPRSWVFILDVLSLVYIWSYAPIVFKSHPMKIETIKKNRKYAHILILLEAFICIYLIIKNSNVIYIISITTCIVAIMMYVALRKEEKS